MRNPATSIVRMVRGYDAVFDLEQKAMPLVLSAQKRPQHFILKIQTSEGEDLEVQMGYHIYGCQPLDYNFDKAKKNYTVQRGSRSKARVYFTLDQKTIRQSQAYKDHQAAINQAAMNFNGLKQTKVEEMARTLLEENYPELVNLIDLEGCQIKDWMDANDWTYPADLDFGKFDWSGWIVTSGPDGYGHMCGTAAAVDFQQRKVWIHGWSSDD